MASDGQKEKTIGRLTREKGGMATYQGNDMLFVNQFVADDFNEVPQDKSMGFAQYVERTQELKERQKQLQVVKERREPTDAVLKRPGVKEIPKQPLPPGPSSDIPMTQSTRQKKTLVCINSKRRDRVRYPNISDFRLFLGKSFSNVVSIKLVSLEMANADAAINSLCNKMYWINKEDYDLGYPIYTAAINTGSYRMATIQTELDSKLNNVSNKRRGGQGFAHYYIVDMNEDTDYVGFTSILATSAPTNAVQTISGSSTIIINQPAHGYNNGERIHIIGVRGIVGGIQSSYINGAYNVTVGSGDPDRFSFEIAQVATENADAGGTLIKTGREADWQMLNGQFSDTFADKLGFRSENSSVDISQINPLTSVIVPISNIIPGAVTTIEANNHGLKTGDRVFLGNVYINPSIYADERYRGVFTVSAVPNVNSFEIAYRTTSINNINEAYVGTQRLTMYFPNHGFNRIVSITKPQVNYDVIEISTLLDHGLETGDGVYLSGTDSIPSIDGYHENIRKVDNDTFEVTIEDIQWISGGINGRLTKDHIFYLYGVEEFGGFRKHDLNNTAFEVRDIIDADHFTFTTVSGFADRIETGGGMSLRINSKFHGWAGVHDNSPNGVLYKPVNLAGENYAYLCMPGITNDMMMTVDPVRNVFSKVFLTANPGYVIFNEFVTEPITFEDKPLPNLDEVHFEFRSPDNFLLEFNGLEWSATLEITELIPQNDANSQTSTPLVAGATVSSGTSKGGGTS